MPIDEKGSFGAAAFVAIFKKNKLLLVKHHYGSRRWSLPGGGLAPSEAVEQGAAREVTEETGLQVSELRVTGVYDQQWQNDAGVIADVKLFLFRARRKRGILLKNTDETEEAGFFAEDELPDLYAGQRQLAHDAFAHKKARGVLCQPLARDR